MTEEIRKPLFLKGFPMVYIRPLPSIYYYSYYSNQNFSYEAYQLYDTSLIYLSDIIKTLGEETKNQQFIQLSNSLIKLENPEGIDLIAELKKITRKLSELFSDDKVNIRDKLNKLKPDFKSKYREKVKILKILVVDNILAQETAEKISTTLTKFCHYRAENTTLHATDYNKKILNSDFVVFLSTDPSQIHESAKSLSTYRRPGLALAEVKEDLQGYDEAMRHAAQLEKIGFPVIYNLYTPIRLFTSIDKIYMNYHLRGNN